LAFAGAGFALLFVIPVSGCGSQADPQRPEPIISIGQAIVLGLVEGITEYLPVSSTGHLVITARFLGLDESSLADKSQQDAVKAYEIVIQFGAILAVLILYSARVGEMVLGVVGKNPAGRRLLINIVIAFVPAAVLGLLLSRFINDHLQSTGPVAAALLVGGAGMVLFERSPWAGKSRSAGMPLNRLEPMTALCIGLCQCLSLWPGTSRSMVTIVGALILGLSAAAAAEFSFLLGLATLSAATFYKLWKTGPGLILHIGMPAIIIGVIVSGLAAAVAVQAFVQYLNKRGLEPFGWYRIALGLLLMLVMFRA